MGNDAEKSHQTKSGNPRPELRDAGRPMFRIDTTLDDPIRTSILCGRCAEITWKREETQDLHMPILRC